MVKKQSVSKSDKIFVIDTSVILYDHMAIYNFEDNDIVIPITVFEELDDFKKGNDTINFESREFIRNIDKLASKNTLNEWVSIGKNKGRIKVVMNDKPKIDAIKIFDDNKPDHQILNSALLLAEEFPYKKITIVSKDINLRLKAKALKLNAEDYLTGKIKDIDKLITGKDIIENVDDEVINKLYTKGTCLPEDIGLKDLLNNKYLIIKNEKSSILAYYSAKNRQVEKIEKETCYKITPRNSEQAFALHAILNPDVKLVSLQGVAGTGKTLIALAGALQQKRDFKQIYLARPIIPLSNKDLGYLPGNIADKINPYMEALYDNLKFIQSQFRDTDKEYKFLQDCIKDEKVIITPLAYIRGRSISNVIFIIDECLTKDHLVWTSDGKAIPIQNFKNNDIVNSFDVNNKTFNNNLISNFFQRKTNEIIDIKTSKGIFECTPSHQWWVYENGLELKKKLSKDLTTKDLIMISENMPHYISNNLSIEESKLLALILTDGHIDKNLKEIKVEMSKDKDWLFDTFVEVTKNFKTKISENLNRNTIKCSIKTPSDIKNFVNKYNLIPGKKSNNIVVPDEIWNAPLDSVKNFISVCFDAEGDINFKSKNNNLVISFSTTSKIFAYQLSSLLLKFNIQSHVYTYQKKKEKCARIYRVSIINFFAKEFLEKIQFTMKRKQNIYNIIKDYNYENTTIYPLKIGMDIKKQIINSTRWIKSDFTSKDLDKLLGTRVRFDKNKSYSYNTFIKLKEIAKENNIIIDNYQPCCRINSISSREVETDVYDFTVENDHTFIVNGVISSNCQNLTPHEVKTIITRAGEGTKIIFTGDINQIDTPYLDSQSNGLSHMIAKIKDQPIYSHITLEKGERSELANIANDLL